MKKIIRALKQEDHSRGCAFVASYYSDESGRKGLQRERAANSMYTETFDNKRIVCKYYKRNDLKESGWHGELIDYVSGVTFAEVGTTLKEVRYKMNRVIRNRYASEPVKPEVLVDKLDNVFCEKCAKQDQEVQVKQAATGLVTAAVEYKDMVHVASWLFGTDSPAYHIAELSASVAYTPCILLEAPRVYKDYLRAKMVFKGAGYPEYAGAVDNLYRGMRNEPNNESTGLDSGVSTTL